MKFAYFISVITFIIISHSCSPKTEQDPQPNATQNITTIKRDYETYLEISTDDSGNPIIIKGLQKTLKIAYEKNLVKTIDVDYNYTDKLIKYTVNYLNANELTIAYEPNPLNPQFTSWLNNANLKFNNLGQIESITKKLAGFSPETYSYRYNTNNNLIAIEKVMSGTKNEQTYIYEDYDEMLNPFFAKAKIWSIINIAQGLDVGIMMNFPISRNNPGKIYGEKTYLGNKLTYTYDKKSYPAEITEYYYYVATPPLKDSDYKSTSGSIKLSYQK